ncbi:NACHT domain-containing protein [Janthinobacterium sp. PSPC1-1]|uniref:NACHT domain-containing protein n=1 Tax=Janthinobacterium sp. PSPC1-1 TaxID=2804581 RepID=UPI003CEF51B7
MEELKEDASGEVIILLQKMFDYIISTAVDGGWWSRVIAIFFLLIIIFVAMVFFCKAFVAVLEQLLKLFEFYKNSSSSFVFGKEKKKIIRKRQQFFSVVDADLAYMAKSENWNDQHFTDLEAEVEIEGGYYASALSRLARKKFYGIRRVSSLIKAIEYSAERVILLVGEPGSGKSVALRHLAKQLSERGKKSRNLKGSIPLYINLRELDVADGCNIDSDLIENFVLENIRRGDADTSAYVRENWVKNKDEGIWLFLFDSFDEIPEVLHAATGSAAVKKYSEAIREFLEGMGGCRGVLASREYKGPESLPWEKFRIIALSNDRQRQLVENSFLDSSKNELVNQHLAMDRSKLGNNPLFLSLLCRYVKDEGVQPVNDHQLLTSHIERLAFREPDYTARKYGLSGDDLLSSAELLAVTFAKNNSLSLAPKLDEIFLALSATGITNERLQNIIAALVDVKIGRNDVSTAHPGDRRFAFSHRRYQETLFANYIAKNPGFITPDELLREPQWREYAVTLLQTQDFNIIEPIIEAAKNIILDASISQSIIPAINSVDNSLGYYSWNSDFYMRALEILQEGFVRRLIDVPSSLSLAISKLLSPRWSLGDHFDRYMVIKLGGLLPQPELIEKLTIALRDNLSEFGAIAFKQCIFLTGMSPKLDKLIRKKIADEVLISCDKSSRFRLAALAAQLPSSVGANFVIKRCLKLRSVIVKLNIISLIVLLPNILILKIMKKLNIGSDFQKSIGGMTPSFKYNGGSEWLIPLIILPFSMALVALIRHFRIFGDVVSKNHDSIIFSYDFLTSKIFICFAAVYLLLSSFLVILYRNRDEGKEINISSLFSSDNFSNFIKETSMVLMAPVLFVIAGIPWVIGNSIYWIAIKMGFNVEVNSKYMQIGVPAFFLVLLVCGFFLLAREKYISRKMLKKFNNLKRLNYRDYEIFMHAEKISEVLFWLNLDKKFLSSCEAEVRSASIVVLADPVLVSTTIVSDLPLLNFLDDEYRFLLQRAIGKKVFFHIRNSGKL